MTTYGAAPLAGFGDGSKEYVHNANAEVRRGFISKVYGILTVQLALTAVIAAPFVGSQTVKESVRSFGMPFVWGVLALNIAMICYISCNDRILRDYPSNYYWLFGFTATEGILVGVICSTYSLSSVLFAVMATSILVGCLTIYAQNTESDFTDMGPYLFVGCICLMMFGFFLLFVHAPFAHKIYCCLGILLFSFFLVYDTQLIMGGGHVQLEVDQYCSGALQLYLDVIQLFLYILQLFGDRD